MQLKWSFERCRSSNAPKSTFSRMDVNSKHRILPNHRGAITICERNALGEDENAFLVLSDGYEYMSSLLRFFF